MGLVRMPSIEARGCLGPMDESDAGLCTALELRIPIEGCLQVDKADSMISMLVGASSPVRILWLSVARS